MMKVKDIIEYFDALTYIRINQMDAFIDQTKEEEIYCGSVLNMPWYILNYCLDGKESISIGTFDRRFDNGETIKEPCIDIYVLENEPCSITEGK